MSAKVVSQSTLVVDIAPGLVKGAIVGYPKGKSPVILVERSRVFQHEERMIASLRDLFHDVLKAIPDLPEEYSRQPEHVLISLSKPWFKTDGRTVSSIQEELVRVLGFKKGVAIENSVEVYTRGASSIYEIKNVLLARVLEDSMELRFLEKGRRDEYLRVPFGNADIKAAIAKKLKIPEELSTSYISLATEDLWNEEMRRKISAVLEEQERVLFRGVKDVKNWPGHILLICDEVYAPVYTTYFKDMIRGVKVSLEDSTTLLASYSKLLL